VVPVKITVFWDVAVYKSVKSLTTFQRNMMYKIGAPQIIMHILVSFIEVSHPSLYH
jgi:hypothetical protein